MTKSNPKVKSMGELLWEFREKKGVSQNLLGMSVGRSYNNIMLIENDRYTFRGLATLFRLKDQLGIPDKRFMESLRQTVETNEEKPPKVIPLDTLLDVAGS